MEKIIVMLILALFVVFPIRVSSQDTDRLTKNYTSQTESVGMKKLKAREMKAFTARMNTQDLTNPNTLNYDLKYQRMDVTLDPILYNISGSVTSHFKAKENMNSIYFDFTDTLAVSKVQYHGIDLNFQQLPTKELKIDFPAAIPANVLDSLTIHYSGTPDTYNGQQAAFQTGLQNGIPLLATLDQYAGAQDWFPTKQSLNDKIDRFDIKITTPIQYSVGSNGKLISETILPNGQKLTFWRTMYPIAAYLIALSITNFLKFNDTIGNPPFPFVNYIFSNTFSDPISMSNIEWTKQAMNTFENYFGPYPFRDEKYGHMEYHNAPMENQTMSSIGEGLWGKNIIAHELAHQWFGDKVTCATLNDDWLNEGFATFGEHVVNEKLLMTHSEFMTYLSGQKNEATTSLGGSMYYPSSGSDYTQYVDVYSKGGYVVRMIKWILGDDVFYKALKEYHSRPNLAYNYVTTEDLKASLHQSTGKDFTEFFKDWVYGRGYPSYNIKWKQLFNQDIAFKVSQTQSHPSVNFFEMPLPIKVVGTTGEIAYFTLNNTSNNQYFTESVSFPIAHVEFNYNYQILEKNSTVNQDNTLSVKDSRLGKDYFTIYPNPAKNEFFINFPRKINRKVRIEIYDVSGKLVISEDGVSTEDKKVILTDQLINGTYLVKAKGQGLDAASKVIINR